MLNVRMQTGRPAFRSGTKRILPCWALGSARSAERALLWAFAPGELASWPSSSEGSHLQFSNVLRANLDRNKSPSVRAVRTEPFNKLGDIKNPAAVATEAVNGQACAGRKLAAERAF